MQHSQKAGEPSMDEILASIRKIIADDPVGGPNIGPNAGPGDASQTSMTTSMAKETAAGPAAVRVPGPRPGLHRETQLGPLPGGQSAPVPAAPVAPQVAAANGGQRASALDRDLADLLGEPLAEPRVVNGGLPALLDREVVAGAGPLPQANAAPSRLSWLRGPSNGAAAAAPIEPVLGAPGVTSNSGAAPVAAPASHGSGDESQDNRGSLGQGEAKLGAGGRVEPQLAAQVEQVKAVTPGPVAAAFSALDSIAAAGKMASPAPGAGANGLAAVEAGGRSVDGTADGTKIDATPRPVKAAPPAASAPVPAPTPSLLAQPIAAPAAVPPPAVAKDKVDAGVGETAAASPGVVAPPAKPEAAAPQPLPVDTGPGAARMKAAAQVVPAPRHPAGIAAKAAAPVQSAASGSARLLDDALAELLRPMVREWLDENMSRALTKAVEIEIAERAHAELAKRRTS